MMTDRAFPIRGETHQQEESSERFFRNLLPRSWVCEKPANDYGVDLRIDIFEDNRATGLELLVQLKSSARTTEGDFEVVRLATATYNHLWDKLQVAMLVKFIESEDEAYWLLFKDIPPPQQEAETFSVRIPKANRLSAIQWPEIQAYVRTVTDTKLAAARRSQRERTRRSAK
jgi:uncharacterized protein DUF4365